MVFFFIDVFINPLIQAYQRGNHAVIKASGATRAKYNGKYNTNITPLGKKIADNTEMLKDKLLKSNTVFGYHGTRLTKSLKKQIVDGVFEQRGKKIFFEITPGRRVTVYAENVPGFNKGVILFLASDSDVNKDDQFSALYFNEAAKVHIVEAYEVNEEYEKVAVALDDTKMEKLKFLSTQFFTELKNEMSKKEDKPEL